MVVCHRLSKKVPLHSLCHPVSTQLSKSTANHFLPRKNFHLNNRSSYVAQVPSLLVMCIVFCIYGLVQPYKSRVTNIIEMMVQVTFIILLTLESTSFLRDIYNVFPLPQVRVGNSANVTMDVCTDGRSGVSVITSILLPFYYLPLLALIAVATVKLSIHIW